MKTTDQIKSYIQDNYNILHKNQNFNFVDFELTNVTSLSGGYVNFVYRLLFSGKSTLTTAILKYFPPYLAYDESFPVSQDRYFVEKSALQLFTDTLSYKSSNQFTARTPKLFHHDDENFVLIMEDVGEQVKTLYELLKPNSELNEAQISKIAAEIKNFVHFLAQEANITPQKYPVFENNAMIQVLSTYFRNYSLQQAQLYSLEAELEAYLDKLDDMVKSVDVSRDKGVFTFGDLWPNSILVDVNTKQIWFIDWESARFQVDSICDVEQLLRNLWLMKQSWRLFDAHKIDFLAKELHFLYFGNSKVDWRKIDERKKNRFVLGVLCLPKEMYRGIDSPKAVILQALDEVK